MLKRGLETYSRTDRGAIFAIKGCPMHEDPLHLIPHHLRDDFFDEYGVRIEESITTKCDAFRTRIWFKN